MIRNHSWPRRNGPLALAGAAVLLLFLPACRTPEAPDKPDKGWVFNSASPPAETPPPRLTSPIAPAPQTGPDREPGARAAGSAEREKPPGDLHPKPPGDGKLYSFSARDLDFKEALALFARNNELNIIPDPDVTGTITIDFRNLPLDKSMEALLEVFGLYAEIDRGLVRVRKTKTEFFTVDYLRLTRTGNGSTTANVSSGSGGGGGASGGGGGGGGGAGASGAAGGGGGDSTSVSISKVDHVRFWEELEEQLKAMLSSGGKVSINRMAGTIMVTDQKASVDHVAEYLKQIKRTLHRQVDIEAQIFEVVLNDEFHFGVDWQNVMASVEKWAISSGGIPVGIPSSDLTVHNPIGGLTPGAPALSLAVTKDQTKIVIDALKQMGRLEVVSQPRIRTLNNQAALIKVGTDKPFFRSTTIITPTGTSAPQTQTDVAVQSITIGTVLSLTPQISEDGWITMDVSPVITRLVDTLNAPNNAATAPEVDIKQVSALVRMREGTTVIIGGLIQNEHSKTTRKIPILGDIPILGYPFRGVFDNTRRTELVIFITPTVVD